MLVALNKPYGVLCQFSGDDGRPTLAEVLRSARAQGWVRAAAGQALELSDWSQLYPAGRLDLDSEGLLLLSDDGALIHQISDPKQKWPKTYWVQVETRADEPTASDAQLASLRRGVILNDGPTLPAEVRRLDDAEVASLWAREPPVRYRAAIPTCWLEIILREGRNRQVRRMTAAVGLPTLRLVRVGIGRHRLDDLPPGHVCVLDGQASGPSNTRLRKAQNRPLAKSFSGKPAFKHPPRR